MTVSPQASSCRDYTARAVVDGETRQLVGHACQLPDGSWRVVEGTPQQPESFVIVYPALAYPDYAYAPWFWGPPIGLSIGAFVFVDHDYRFHDFGRVHRFGSDRFAFGGFHHDGFGHGGWGGMAHGGRGRG